jgi:tRNA dimethylallyltransferase
VQGRSAGEPQTPRSAALIVAGPTASGKSALALDLAERLRGTIINADSMQIYRELRILTARPSAAEEAQVPHALYGVRSAAEPCSAGWWRTAALAEMERASAAGRLPILCGGTGLYLTALTDGLADIPDPGPAARAEARDLLDMLGPAGLHERLGKIDPVAAAALSPADGQRLVRAWEVWRGTGRRFSDWQAGSRLAPPRCRFAAILIDPPRDTLRSAVATRFATMLQQGALDEVRALLALGLDASLPAMRALGVPELAAHLAGEITLAEVERRVTLATGRYTKRQTTWFRHHKFADQARTHTMHARYAGYRKFSESDNVRFLAFIEGLG